VASLSGGPSIDMPAGPSELLVIADDSADPALVAADLLSQAEHDAAAQVLLVTPSRPLVEAVRAELEARARTLPRRALAEASLGNAKAIVTADLAAAVAVANLYAPEHLSLAVADPERLLPAIRNAGAVFAGRAAAETFGDYLAGSSHVLPTDGAARSWSGVSVYSFLKAMSVQQVSPAAARAIAAPAAALARLEGLEAHAQAADARSPLPLARGAGGGSDESVIAGNLPTPQSPPASGRGRLARLARPAILALPAFDIAANANDAFGPDAIKLDANENAYKPLVEGGLAADVNRYPEPQPPRLRAAMAALYGVEAESLLVTRGADDAIDLLVRTFVGEGEAVAICQPTFSAYAHFAQLAGARVIETQAGRELRLFGRALSG
jgi:hypothetical protein